MSGARIPGLHDRRPLLSGLIVAAVSVALLGCGEEPKKPPELTGFSPAKPSVEAGGIVGIKVSYQENDYQLETFQWTAEAGKVEGDGQAEITYQAPDDAGDYKLTVTVAYGDEGTEASLDTTVEVTAAEAEAEPAVPAAAAEQPTPAAAAAEGAAVEAPPLGETPILEQPPITEPPLPAEGVER